MLEFIRPYSDIIITICSIMFTVSLLPQILINYHSKVCGISFASSIPTVIFMIVLVIVYIANNFWISVGTGLVTASIWGILAIQRYLYESNV